MKVVIRADANQVLGTGHIMRCTCLADELRRRGAEITFLSRDLPEYLRTVLAQKGHAVKMLTSTSLNSESPHDTASAESTWSVQAQLADSQAAIKEVPFTDCLIVDHYGLAQPWESCMRKVSGKIMVIDDLVNRRHDCDLLLNQNLGSRTQDYLDWLPPHCGILAGPSYALLRPEFESLRLSGPKSRSATDVKKILITMGGIDRENVTGNVLAILARSALPRTTELSVVMGAQAPWLEEIKKQAAQMPLKTHVYVNIQNMGALMVEADLAIGAAGSTSWERCCLGLPSFMIVIAENQRSIASALHAAGAAVNLGIIADDNFEKTFLDELNQLLDTPSRLEEMSSCAMRITDGSGTRKVADQIFAAAQT